MIRQLALWLVVGLCCALLPAQGAVIRGRLRVAGPPGSVAKRTAPARSPHPDHPAASGVRGAATDAVIYVEQVPAATDSVIALGDTVATTMALVDRAFVPRVVSIAAGDRVDLPNLDPVYHDVFSLSPTKNFELGRYARGQSKRVLFDRPGLVNVYCAIHPAMAAFVLVLPHHVFARPDSAGLFALPALPAGHYTVCVWHPDLRGLRREVMLRDSTDLVLDLSL